MQNDLLPSSQTAPVTAVNALAEEAAHPGPHAVAAGDGDALSATSTRTMTPEEHSPFGVSLIRPMPCPLFPQTTRPWSNDNPSISFNSEHIMHPIHTRHTYYNVPIRAKTLTQYSRPRSEQHVQNLLNMLAEGKGELERLEQIRKVRDDELAASTRMVRTFLDRITAIQQQEKEQEQRQAQGAGAGPVALEGTLITGLMTALGQAVSNEQEAMSRTIAACNHQLHVRGEYLRLKSQILAAIDHI